MKTNEKISIHEVVNMNGKEKKFSFLAAKKHFSTGFYNLIMQVEGRYLMDKKGQIFGAAQLRHYSLDRNELQNKAFTTVRTALQKGKLPKGTKEKTLKEICFAEYFVVTLEKCQIRTGFQCDRLLRAIDRELKVLQREQKKSAKKSAKKSNKK